MAVVSTGCEKDGSLITLGGFESSELVATKSEVVLDESMADQQVLSLAWNIPELTVSNQSMSAPKLIKTSLQVSLSEGFADNVNELNETVQSRSFSGAELNSIVKNIGAEADVAASVYFRIKTSIGNNMEAQYSNVVKVLITGYDIDMTWGYVLNKNKENTGVALYSEMADGVYKGFMGATSWYNYYLKEGNGTIWGNDGVTGTEFVLSSSEVVDERWNFWFPGIGGCYYVIVDTKAKEWSAKYVENLTVGGDISGEMTYDRSNNKWTLPFTATSASATITIGGNTKLYNKSTGTDDAKAIAGNIWFGLSNDKLTISESASDVTIDIPAVGDYSLVIDLSNPSQWTIGLSQGDEPTEVIYPYLYLPGVDDVIAGSWTFDNYISLYNEEDLEYAGVVNVNSAWGYTMNPEKDNWDLKYTFASGDALSGMLVKEGSNNIPAPDAGLYLIKTSLKSLSYQLIGIGSKIYVSGLNNTWDFSVTLDATATAGEFEGQITITQASSWGFQIHVDDSWNNLFGGSNGNLFFKGGNITDDASLAPGVYTMKVNLINATYSITK
jgi:hypothetical protein